MAANRSAGFSMVELLVAMSFVVFLLPALLMASGLGAVHMTSSKRDAEWMVAVQPELERVRTSGYAGAAPGSASAHGFSMSWTVAGTDPKTVTFVASHPGDEARGPTTDTVLISFPASDTVMVP